MNQKIKARKLKEKLTKNIRYAKEYFITEKGEIVKIAAIVSTNPDILAKLKKDEEKQQKDSKKDKKDDGKTRIKQG